MASRRGRALRSLLIVLAVCCAIIAVVAVWPYASARRALPRLDGSITVPGLNAKVTIIRDTHGVPHIMASNLHDLFFAQGYVTAQDRLWQMDATRRYASGEMAEIFGETFVAHDREQRILGLKDAAGRLATALPQAERSRLEAYAQGVNAFIAARRNSLPLEFRLFRYVPRPWRVEDSMLVQAHMAKLMNFSEVADLLAREKVTAKLGPELSADLYPSASWRDRPPAAMAQRPDWSQPDSEPEASSPSKKIPRRRSRRRTRSPSVSSAFPAASAPPEKMPRSGSNNWVVSGAHTASGKPLLSNDMHLPHQIPGIWYEAHLRCLHCVSRLGVAAEDLDVAGVTLPGVPYVIVGHNQRIAWGFTNLGASVIDLFVETLNGDGEYQTPQGWQPLEKRQEIIHIKDKPDVTIEVRSTRHGPIITPLFEGEIRPLALKWTLYDANAADIPFFDLDTSRDWQEFRAAFSRFLGPAMNVVFADLDGHIGYQAAGRIPLRAGEKSGPSHGGGLTPMSGSDDSNEWRGYIPFDQLPSVYDPPSGILATANNRITPDDYRYTLAREWGAPYRAERIYRMLTSGQKFTPADMLGLQTDVYSEFDRFCAQRFVYAVDRSSKASPLAREAANLMREWDGRVTKDSPAPTLVARARGQLLRMLLEPKLGVEWRQYQWEMSSVALENMLLRRPERWLPREFSSWTQLLAAAVEASMQELADGFGDATNEGALRRLRNLRWGDESQIALEHPVFGKIPFIRRWAGTGVREQSGNRNTVQQTASDFGPSERMTVDLGDLDRSTLNIVTGQSGNLLSPYFKDQWEAWLAGFTFQLPWTDSAIQRQKAHELALRP